MTHPSRLESIVLRCAGLERSREFYEAVGFSFTREQHGNGPVHYAYETNGLVVELYPSTGDGPKGVRIGVEVSSVSDASRRARAIDATFVRDSATSIALRDPDGNDVVLTESVQPWSSLHRFVDEVLFHRWDPIGVNDVPQARDEYRTYVPEIVSMMRSGAGEERISQRLVTIAETTIGVVTDKDVAARVARALANWVADQAPR